jgi:hypothetical protein
MKVNKEIVKKIKRLHKIEQEMEAVRNELHEFFGVYQVSGVYINDYSIVDEPRGHDQGGGEYREQWIGYGGDIGGCTYYYPIEDSEKFVAIAYEF